MINKQINLYMDEETGEVVSSKETQLQSQLWKDGGMLLPRAYKTYVRQACKLSDIIPNRQEVCWTYLLAEHIYKDTNMIYVQRGKTTSSPANLEDICNILNLKPRRTKEYLKHMKELGIIAEVVLSILDLEYHTYIFNPLFINSSKYVNPMLYMIFKPYLEDYFPEWIKEKYEEIDTTNTQVEVIE